jgi:hypothetical protein
MKKLFFIISTGAIFAACTEFDEPVQPMEDAAKEQTEQSATPREKLSEFVFADDPFLLANVQKAYNEIAGGLRTRAEQLQPTHRYVRFLPQDTTHVYILIDSLRLPVFAYPYNLGLTPDEICYDISSEIFGICRNIA